MALFYDSGELGPAYATVAMATAVASVLGGPIAACLLMLNGVAGLHGWQASPVCLSSLPHEPVWGCWYNMRQTLHASCGSASVGSL